MGRLVAAIRRVFCRSLSVRCGFVARTSTSGTPPPPGGSESRFSVSASRCGAFLPAWTPRGAAVLVVPTRVVAAFRVAAGGRVGGSFREAATVLGRRWAGRCVSPSHQSRAGCLQLFGQRHPWETEGGTRCGVVRTACLSKSARHPRVLGHALRSVCCVARRRGWSHALSRLPAPSRHHPGTIPAFPRAARPATGGARGASLHVPRRGALGELHCTFRDGGR